MLHLRKYLVVPLLAAFAVSASALPPASVDAPFADPRVDFPVSLTADAVTAWRDGEARVLRLDGDAAVRVGAYGFRGSSAVVRIETEVVNGTAVRHLAAFVLDARSIGDAAARAGLTAPRDSRGDAPGLLVTAATTGPIRLDQPGQLIERDTLPDDPLIDRANDRIAAHRAAVGRPGLQVEPAEGLPEAVAIRRERRRQQIAEEQRRLFEARPGVLPPEVEPLAADDPDARADLPPPSVLPARGAVAYSMDRWSAQIGDDETAVSLVGDVRLVFEDYESDRVVTLRAERVVVFVDHDAPAPGSGGVLTEGLTPGGQLDAGALRGVYLEDNAVISDGQYTVRAPRVFYDLARDRATLLDAVLFTYDVRRRVPLYLRAAEVRQTTASDFAATDARLTTSAFAEPHFSIGAGELTLSQFRRPDGEVAQFFAAEDATLRVGEAPVFYLPRLQGAGRDTPLRSVNADYSSDDGVEVQTKWDLFALLGRPRPEGVDAEARIDYLGEHGPGLGVSGRYDTDNQYGNFLGYLLLDDSGEDEIGGRTVNQEDELRGVARVRHREVLPDNFEVTLEGAYVSDPTFLEEFYPGEAAAGRPYETAANLRWVETDQAIDLVATTNLSGFTEQLDRLQARGYTVERYPELSHRVLGGELLDGRLTWYSQNSLSQLRIQPGDDAPEDRGFNDALSQRFFGVDADVSFRDRLSDLNVPLQSRRRLDSRQELVLPLAAGPIDVSPYVVGRVTAYDDDFAEFNGGNDDRVRFWGEAGLRVGTELSRLDPEVTSNLLDLDGLRHVVEPTATLFLNGSTLDANDLPEYDRGVESLSDGAGVRLGVNNTWQTRRGGEGRWRTVDWITWQTDLVLRADDAEVDAELPRFFDYRPEYSVGGDHLYTELLWMVTDTLGVAGQLTHSLESDRVAQWRLGATLEHSPRLNSFLAYEEIDVLGSRLLTWGFGYELTTKYRVGFRQTLDFAENDTRRIDLVVDRRLPQWTLRVTVGFDEVDDEQTVGIGLIPQGAEELGRTFAFD
ncbi:MAG: hypothetical protein AAF710_02025 [Planctomycetota bacterium]